MDPITRISTLGASGVASGYPPGDYWLSTNNNMDPGTDTYGAVVADSSGNIYATANVYNNSPATNYGVLIKKDNLGVVQWARKISDSSIDVSVGSISFDGTYLYVVGRYNRTGSGEETLVLKFDTSGTLIWQKSYSENTNTTWKMYHSVVDSSGNLTITGTYPVTGGTYIGVMKINSSGTLQWAKGFWNASYGASNDTFPSGLGLLSNGDVVFAGSVTYGTGSMQFHAIMTRLSGSTGNSVWSNQWLGTTQYGSLGSKNQFLGCAVDSNDNIYATYNWEWGGKKDLMKFNSSGAYQSSIRTGYSRLYIDSSDNVWGLLSSNTTKYDTSLNRILYHYVSISTSGVNVFANLAKVPGSDIYACSGGNHLFTLPLDGGLTGTYTPSWGTVTYSTNTPGVQTPVDIYTTGGSLGTTTPSITTTTTTLTVASFTYVDKPYYLPPYP